MIIEEELLRSSGETEEQYLSRLHNLSIKTIHDAMNSGDPKVQLAAAQAFLKEETDRNKNQTDVTVVLKLDLPLEGLMRLTGYEGVTI